MLYIVDGAPSSCLVPGFFTTSSAAAVAGGASSGGTGVLVLMAVLPVFHLSSLAALDALSHLPSLKVRHSPFRWYISCWTTCGWGWLLWRDEAFRWRALRRLFLSEWTPCVVLATNYRYPGYLSSPPLHAFPHPVSSCLPAGLLQMSERDCIAVMFCGSHKTLAFGIPLIKVRFSARLEAL